MKNLFFIVGLLLLALCSCKKNADNIVNPDSDTTVIKEYFSDGTIKTEISAIGELRQGWTRNYDRTGRLLSEVYYVNNVREGVARNYYAKTGKLNSTITYKNGIKSGDEIWYYETGKKYRVSPFVDGKIEGIQKLYYESGQIMAEVPYKAGYPGVGLREYKSDGTLIKDYPQLVIRREDHLKDANKILLFISLSDEVSDLKFYKGLLAEGKFLHKNLLVLASHGGTSQIDYNIPPGALVSQKTVLTASFKTRRGNPLVLSKTYSLQVTNN
jgi:antitoxin component YwqK of YwqJK toxin-antitoxin module